MTYFEHERIMSRMERKARRLWLASLVLLVLLVLSNAAWIIEKGV